MNAQEWDRQIEEALRRQGKEYTADLRRLMHNVPDPATKDSDKYVAVEVTNAMQRLFWRRVVEGEAFGDPSRVVERFGRSLEENYGLDSGPFLNLARAYWTYQIELRDLFPEHSGTGLSDALQAVEIKIRELFFPTPGPMAVPSELRRQAQRDCLEQFAHKLLPQFLRRFPAQLIAGVRRQGKLMPFIATAWNNGSWLPSGGGYGFRISPEDRDRYLSPTWDSITLELPVDDALVEVKVNIARRSFWSGACTEVINRGIGRWLIERRLAPWASLRPPRFHLLPVKEQAFRVEYIRE